MSVLINGMEMPRSCEACGFMHSGYYKGKHYPCVCYAVKGRMLIKPTEADLRHGMCPLVEVPPHGRLIDADALKSKFRHSEGESDTDSAWISTIRRFITQADTIIEAEGVEE